MILAQRVVPAPLALDKLRRRRQERPVQILLLAQHLEKAHAGTRLGFVGLGEVRAVDHPVPGRQQQAARPAHHQQAPDPGPLDRLDDRVRVDSCKVRSAQHRVHTGDSRL
ncbi:hypothetical protein D3C80_1453620 [compost metagenome]